MFKVILLLLFTVGIFANETAQNRFNVEALDSDINLEKLENKYNVIKPESYGQGKRVLSPIEIRDDALFRSDLDAVTQDWDELDKDILVLRARKKPLSYLFEKYPKIDKKSLKSLKNYFSDTD